MLTEPELAWGELFAVIFGSALIAFGVGAIAIFVWLALMVVAWPADLATKYQQQYLEQHQAPIRPDPTHTPGEINDNIDQSNIGQTICNPHWSTKSIRPDVDFTDKLKAQQLAAYGYTSRNKKLYEEDHLISLEIGGHPSDARNLWPEVWAGTCGAHVKDKLENRLHELVCAGKITLAEAQGEIAADWVRSYNLHVGKLVCP